MALGYYSATGKTGVASVTCGPGVTQITTILSTAMRARVPLVVFAGESPMNAKWYNQAIDQAPLVNATGAHYVRAHSAKLMHEYVREAFYTARYERRPTVLGVPYDLQKAGVVRAVPTTQPSASLHPAAGPHAAEFRHRREARRQDRERQAADHHRRPRRGRRPARRPRSRNWPKPPALCSRPACPARGMFDASPYSVGVAGGFAAAGTRELFADADLVIAIGASLTYYTVDGGALFPKAYVAQIDERPLGLRDGARAGDLFLKADAKAGAEAVTAGAEAARRQERRLSLEARPRIASGRCRSIRPSSRSRPAPSIRAPSSSSSTA